MYNNKPKISVANGYESVLDSIIQSLDISEDQLVYINRIKDLAGNSSSPKVLCNLLNVLNDEAHNQFGEEESFKILTCSSVLMHSTEYWYENSGKWGALDNTSSKLISTTAKLQQFDWGEFVNADLAGTIAGVYYTIT